MNTADLTPETTVYTVTISTCCRACAMALAGQAPRLGTIRWAFVNEDREGASSLTIHANSSAMKYHDGSPLLCSEHGAKLFATEAGRSALAAAPPEIPVELCAGPPGYLPARARERALARGEVDR